MADPDLDPTRRAAPSDGRAKAVPQWGLADAALGWMLGLMGTLITLSLVLIVTGARDETELSLGWLAVAMSGMWLGLLAVPLVVPRIKGNGVVADLGLTVRPKDALIGPLWGIAAQLLGSLVYQPILFLFDIDADDVAKPAQEMTDRAGDAFGVVILILIVGVGAPIVEEIFYRGFLQRAMQRRFGMWPGLVGTSLLFGAAHLQWLQFPALVIAGLVFGLLAQRHGRLGPAVTAHITFNMVTVVTLV